MISNYNKAIIKELNPKLLEQLEKLEKNEPKEVQVIPAKNGELGLIYKNNKIDFHIHSRYEPSHEAKKLIDSCKNIQDGDRVLFIGAGLGYHIKEVLNRFSDIRYAIIEPDIKILYRFLERNELKEMYLNQLEGVCTNVQEGYNFLIPFISKDTKTVTLKNYQSFFEKQIKELNQELIISLKKERDVATFLSIAQIRVVETEIENIPDVIRTSYLFDCNLKQFNGKTALLVAAGPSLDDEIENIRYIKEKGLAYVFAVGSAVNALLKKGIHADAVFSYDPTIDNQRVLQLIKEKSIDDIVLIYGAGIGYESLRGYSGPKFFVINSGNYITNHFIRFKDKETDFVAEGATISVMALDCLLKMGFADIVFVGQNLAARGKQIYSQDMYQMLEEQFSEIEEDVNGNMARTNSVYIMMKENLEAIIPEKKEANIWNATKGGLAIRGTTYKPLEQLMKSMEENSVEKHWHMIKKESQIDISYMTKVKNEMLELEEDLERQIALFQRTVDEIERKGNLGLYKHLYALYKKLNLILTRLERSDYSSLMVMPAVFQQYQNLVFKITDFNLIKDPKEQYQVIVKEFRSFYYDYKNTFDFIKEKYSKLNQRLDEFLVSYEEKKTWN